MIKYLLILLFITSAASAQTFPGSFTSPNPGARGVTYNGLKALRELYLPQYDTTYTPSWEGAIVFRMDDQTPYIYRGGKWQIVGGFYTDSAAKAANKPYTIAALRLAYTVTGLSYISSDYGGGTWIDKGVNDGSHTDNTGTILTTANNHWLERQFNGLPYVEWFGAKGDGTFNNGPAFQATINTSISMGYGGALLAGGRYLVTSGCNLSNISPVSNASQFGFTIKGVGMYTEIVSNISGGVLFEFNSASDLQVHFENIFAYDVTGTTLGIRIKRMSRYSTFTNVRLYGFRVGLRFSGESYGISFNNLSIRGSKREAIEIDETALAGGVVTEMRFKDCYFDNNGSDGANGGTAVYTMNLFNAQEWHFDNCVWEGNFGGGFTLRGQSENVTFSGGRFEETQMSFGTGGHIFTIGPSVSNVKITNMELTYDRDGIDGTKSYQFIFAGGKQLIIDNCQIVENSNNTTTPAATDFFGATSSTANVIVRNPSLGINSYYQVVIPPQFLLTEVDLHNLVNRRLVLSDGTKAFRPSSITDSLGYVKTSSPITLNNDGVTTAITINGTAAFGGGIDFKNTTATPGYYFGIIGNTSGNFIGANRGTGRIFMNVDATTDHVTFPSTISGANAVNSSDYITKSQSDLKLDASVATATYATTNSTNGVLPKRTGTTTFGNSIYSDNGTDGTVAGNLFVNKSIYLGVAGVGTQGNSRFRDEDGNPRWFIGILNSIGAKELSFYDISHSQLRMKFDSLTGLADIYAGLRVTGGLTLQGTGGTKHVLKQSTTNGAITSGTITASDVDTSSATGTGLSTLLQLQKRIDSLNAAIRVDLIKTGIAFFSGDGSTTTFDIILPTTPSWANAETSSAAGANITYRAPITNGIRIFYSVAPPVGTNNISISYQYK